MANVQMSGDIGFEELSPALQAIISNGNGSNVDVSKIALKTKVMSITAQEEYQKEFDIPIDNYNANVHSFEVRLGSVWIHPSRYTITGNKLVFNGNETGVKLGRRLDFVFFYIDGVTTTKDTPSTQELADELLASNLYITDMELRLLELELLVESLLSNK